MLEAFARNYELELKYIQTNSTSEVSSLYLLQKYPHCIYFRSILIVQKVLSLILPPSEPPCSLDMAVRVFV